MKIYHILCYTHLAYSYMIRLTTSEAHWLMFRKEKNSRTRAQEVRAHQGPGGPSWARTLDERQDVDSSSRARPSWQSWSTMIYTVLFPPSYSPVTGPRRNPASTSTTTYKTMTTILSARDRLSTFYASNPLLFQKGYAVRRSDLRRLLRRALANDLTNFRFVSNGRG